VSGNVYKQTSPEIPGSNFHETHYYGFFARDVSDMGHQPGGEIIASLPPSLHICKDYHINAKYMVN
jgi:hypothetical protein